MLQGALDGGLDIPHSEKRFVGYSADDKSLDAETLRKHIYGGHVAEYMEEMQEEAPEKYQVTCSPTLHKELTHLDFYRLLFACLLQHHCTLLHDYKLQGRYFGACEMLNCCCVCAVTLCQVD